MYELSAESWCLSAFFLQEGNEERLGKEARVPGGLTPAFRFYYETVKLIMCMITSVTTFHAESQTRK